MCYPNRAIYRCKNCENRIAYVEYTMETIEWMTELQCYVLKTEDLVCLHSFDFITELLNIYSFQLFQYDERQEDELWTRRVYCTQCGIILSYLYENLYHKDCQKIVNFYSTEDVVLLNNEKLIITVDS